MKIINNQLDIKLEQFTQEEPNVVLRKSKNNKTAGLYKILPEIWKTREFDDIQLRYCNDVYSQDTIYRQTAVSTLPQKGWHQNTQELPRYNAYFYSGQDLEWSPI